MCSSSVMRNSRDRKQVVLAVSHVQMYMIQEVTHMLVTGHFKARSSSFPTEKQ